MAKNQPKLVDIKAEQALAKSRIERAQIVARGLQILKIQVDSLGPNMPFDEASAIEALCQFYSFELDEVLETFEFYRHWQNDLIQSQK